MTILEEVWWISYPIGRNLSAPMHLQRVEGSHKKNNVMSGMPAERMDRKKQMNTGLKRGHNAMIRLTKKEQ